MSNLTSIANKLVNLCKEGKNTDAIQSLYSDDIVSIEAAAGPEGGREVKGKPAVLGKSQWWTENHEIHSAEVKGPFPHGDDKFAVIFNFDVTFKPESRRQKMEEIAVYQVSGDKIIKEEFFYQMG